MNTVTLSDVSWDVNAALQPVLGKYENSTPLDLPQDPLALSWASYHVWCKDSTRRWVDLRDVQAHDHDLVIAEQTRQYYRDQLTMDALKGKEMSNFRKALYEVALGITQLQQRHLGLIYRLPYFYVEDVERATLLSEFTAFPKVGNLQVNARRELTYLKSILKTRSTMDIDEHWFRDHNGEPVLWKVDSKNNLQRFFKSFCHAHREQSITIQGTYLLRPRAHQPFSYWILVQPELT